jgi:hypothetical protein
MQRNFFWFLKALLAINCALIAWELILSQTYISKPLARSHPILGRIEGKGAYIQGKEGYSRTYLNELGMRSAPLTPKKSGEKRILVLGDSYTMAMQVPDKETFTKQLEARISEVDNITVINAGGEGAAPSDYISLAEFNRKTYQPDVVVIQLNEGDFITDPFDKNRPFFFEKKARGYRIERDRGFVSQNALVSQFSEVQKYANFAVMRVAIERMNSIQLKQTEQTSTHEKNDYLATLVPFVIQNLKQKYGDPILVFVPQIDYFSDSISQPTQAERLLEQAAKQQKVTLISMRQDYIKLYRQTYQTAHGFNNTEPGIGHINSLGHQAIAKRLDEVISLTHQVRRK